MQEPQLPLTHAWPLQSRQVLQPGVDVPPSVVHMTQLPLGQQEPGGQLASFWHIGGVGAGDGQVVQPPLLQHWPAPQSEAEVHGPVNDCCAHCARWLLCERSWNGNQNAGQLTSVPAFTIVASRRIAAIQICGRVQPPIGGEVKNGMIGLSVG